MAGQYGYVPLGRHLVLECSGIFLAVGRNSVPHRQSPKKRCFVSGSVNEDIEVYSFWALWIEDNALISY